MQLHHRFKWSDLFTVGSLESETLHVADSFFLFAGKLDLSQIFMMGHSFGGSTALLAASKDDRLRGCIALDPWMFPVAEEHFQLTKPVLVINTELFVNAANVGKVREVAQGACAAVLEGAVHLVHTDAPLLFRSNLLKGALGRLFCINR
jgi:dienelactone hydrolase